VAGVHTPAESVAGAMLGLTLGNYLVARFEGGAAATYDAWLFDGSVYPPDQDFDWTLLFSVTGGQSATTPHAYVTKIVPEGWQIGAPSLILRWLWDQALGEWT
jgi:hypothetical protein